MLFTDRPSAYVKAGTDEDLGRDFERPKNCISNLCSKLLCSVGLGIKISLLASFEHACDRQLESPVEERIVPELKPYR